MAREVHEETGITVKDVAYLDSQPWPMPRSLMLGFRARAVGDEDIHVDADELLVHEHGPDALLAELKARPADSIIKVRHAYDLVHDYATEPPLAGHRPISEQRSALRPCPAYRKRVITAIPTTWGPGFHYAFEEQVIVEDDRIWLVHLAYSDLEMCLAKQTKMKRAVQSETDAMFIPEKLVRVDTLDGVQGKLDALLRAEGIEVPPWMRGAF